MNISPGSRDADGLLPAVACSASGTDGAGASVAAPAACGSSGRTDPDGLIAARVPSVPGGVSAAAPEAWAASAEAASAL